MINQLDLSKHYYVFADKKITTFKQINFIYGRNGTGKSKLVQAIFNQYHQKENMHIFQEFEQFIGENPRLNAITLGQKNSKIQDEVDQIQQQIDIIKADIQPTIQVNSDEPSLYEQNNRLKKTAVKQYKNLERIRRKHAREIKRAHVFLTGPIYNKNHFAKDTVNARKLNTHELEANQHTIQASPLQDLSKLTFPKLGNLFKLIEATNEVLATQVTPSKISQMLQDNPKKQNFAWMGMQLHQHVPDERCAFCGSEISEARWQMLDDYFSDEVQKLERRVAQGLAKVDTLCQSLFSAFEFDLSTWHSKYQTQAQQIFVAANNQRDGILNFLNGLKERLSYKQNHLFEVVAPTNIDVPKDFRSLQTEYDALFKVNQQYDKNLANEIVKAKDNLRLHYVFEAMIECNYQDKARNYEVKEQKYRSKSLELKNRRQTMRQLKGKLAQLTRQTLVEIDAGETINAQLRNLGHNSFTLKLMAADQEPTGFYKIVDYFGAERDIRTLSSGEKNVLAFLYFIYNLRKVESEMLQTKVVIFDDPMVACDSDSQHLIATEIRKLLIDFQDYQFFLLTHNRWLYSQFPAGVDESRQVNYHLNRQGKTHFEVVTNHHEILES
ncbi:MAG: AAA family ATPase [Lactobacillus sp.]|jgi:wobble nucleotide-excising tRNase|nr:AAA family ATPase [Lactobacillus sp.]